MPFLTTLKDTICAPVEKAGDSVCQAQSIVATGIWYVILPSSKIVFEFGGMLPGKIPPICRILSSGRISHVTTLPNLHRHDVPWML